MSNQAAFEVGPLVALDGGETQALATWRDRIATLGASAATFWIDGSAATVELPNVPVGGARWSGDGNAILAGTGSIDVKRQRWLTNESVARLVVAGPPGAGGIVVRATSWSADGRHVACLLDWAGPRPMDRPTPLASVAILDMGPGAAATARVDVAAEDAVGVLIVGQQVVVAAPTVAVWTFDGEEFATLPPTPGEPLWISGGGDGPVFLVDADYAIRIVDPGTWTVAARWDGEFVDAVAVSGGGLIAIDLDGGLHAGRLRAGQVEELGAAATGVGAAKLAVTSDGRLVIAGAGPEPVQTMTFRLDPGG